MSGLRFPPGLPGRLPRLEQVVERSQRLGGQEEPFERRIPGRPCDMPYAVAVLRAEQVTGSEGPPQAVGDLHLDGLSQHHPLPRVWEHRWMPRRPARPPGPVQRDLRALCKKTGIEGVLAPPWAAIRICPVTATKRAPRPSRKVVRLAVRRAASPLPNADSALEDREVQVSRTAPI